MEDPARQPPAISAISSRVRCLADAYQSDALENRAVFSLVLVLAATIVALVILSLIHI